MLRTASLCRRHVVFPLVLLRGFLGVETNGNHLPNCREGFTHRDWEQVANGGKGGRPRDWPRDLQRVRFRRPPIDVLGVASSPDEGFI